MNNIKILPIPKPNKEKEKIVIPEPLPLSHTLFIAPTMSGKSNLIINMILRNKFNYNRYFTKMFIISPTVSYDDSFDILQDYTPKKNHAEIEIIGDIDSLQTTLSDVINEAQEDSKRKRLIILDDCIHLIQDNKILNQLLTSGRHIGLTTWITTQNFRKIPKTVRINSLDFIIFKATNNELKTINEDIGATEFKEFLRKYEEATSEPFGFLHIKTRNIKSKMFNASFKKYL